VGKMRGSDNARLATIQVVYHRRPLKVVGKKFGIKWQALKSAARRVKKHMRQGSAKAQ